MRIRTVVSAIVMCAAPAAWAGEAAEVTPGMLVRVTHPGWKVKGLVLAADPEALTLAVEGRDAPIRLARRPITRIEVGERRSVAAGAARGAWRGLLFGGAAGVVAGIANGGESLYGSAALNAMLGGGFSSLIGGVIGAAKPGERWKPLVSERVRVGVAPQRGRGVSVALSVSF
jgi:hypothetical protein